MILMTLLIVVAPLLLGWALDLLLGDPARLPHPVVLFGRIIAFGERKLNHGEGRKAKGAALAVGCILLTFGATMLLMWVGLQLSAMLNDALFGDGGAAEIPPYALPGVLIYVALCSVLVFYCLAGKTLRREVKATFEAADRGVEEGRRQVSRIVGRDTSALSGQEIRTAALETLAENLSDGVIAPLFWFFLAGIPGMMTYKMINTLDSMIGYRTERYKDFGCWAAKIDDYANYLPARLTALLIVAAAALLKFAHVRLRKAGTIVYGLYARLTAFSLKESWMFVCHFGPQHASPNSGWPEAALASVLNCRFGGTHDYFGTAFYKPYIGTNDRELCANDMRLSLRLCLVAETLMILMMLAMTALSLRM